MKPKQSDNQTDQLADSIGRISRQTEWLKMNLAHPVLWATLIADFAAIVAAQCADARSFQYILFASPFVISSLGLMFVM